MPKSRYDSNRLSGLTPFKKGGWIGREKKRGAFKERPYDPPPCSADDTYRWWRLTKQDEWYRSQMRVPHETLGEVMGVSREAIRLTLDEKTRFALVPQIARLIPSIEARKLVFPMQPRKISEEGKVPKFMWLDPPDPVPLLPPLAALSSWTLFTRCKNCSGNKWMPLVIDEKLHVGCYHCLPPSQWKSFGGKKIVKHLIAEACRKLVR